MSNTIGKRAWSNSGSENLAPEQRRGIRARATLACVGAITALALAVILGCSISGTVGMGTSIGAGMISAILLQCGVKGLTNSLEFEKKLAHSMFELFRDALQKPDPLNDRDQPSADADRAHTVEEMINQSLDFACDDDTYFKRRLLDTLQKETEDPTNKCPKNDREALRAAIAQARSKLITSSQAPKSPPQLKEVDPIATLLKAHTGMRARATMACAGAVASLALAIILGCNISGPIGLGSSIGAALITAGLLKYGVQGLGRGAKFEKKLAKAMFESFEEALQNDFAQSTDRDKITYVKDKINQYFASLNGDYLKLRLLDALDKHAKDPLNKYNADTKTIIQNAINEIKAP